MQLRVACGGFRISKVKSNEQIKVEREGENETQI